MPEKLQPELDAVLHHAAVAWLEDRAFLRVTGSDATRWLNGMVTNSVQDLAPGEGCYAFFLNAQGRILGDGTIYREPGEAASFLLATQNSQLETLRQHLDHFIIMDDVELTPALTRDATLLVLGPEASNLLHTLGLPVPDPLRLAPADSPHGPALLLTSRFVSIPQYELRADSGILAALKSAATAAGAAEVSAETPEALRLLEGRPLYGRDITEKYLPQETNQPQALHFNKGCYLGQEIVERIRSRGQVHRLLTPLALTGSLPTHLPTPIESDGKPVGEITSAALVPLSEGPQLLALGYVRREALDTHATLIYNGGTATTRTTN